jgi:hypothetical protein
MVQVIEGPLQRPSVSSGLPVAAQSVDPDEQRVMHEFTAAVEQLAHCAHLGLPKN